jgi:hypothetical protein
LRDRPSEGGEVAQDYDPDPNPGDRPVEGEASRHQRFKADAELT